MLSPEPFKNPAVNSLFFTRQGETRLGQKTDYFTGKTGFESWLTRSRASFIILGIPEAVGVMANLGKPGCEKMWECFIPKFLNIQFNSFTREKQVAIAGTVPVSDICEKATATKLTGSRKTEYLRKLTGEIDSRVTPLIEAIVKAGKKPVVIGGGHNNAYGLIAGCSRVKEKKINIINIDAHADLRNTEGRHSGNGFSYALKDGYLDKYFVIGLHENYNSHYIMSRFAKNSELGFVSYDSYLRGETSIEKMTKSALNFTGKENTGLEIDLDSLAGFPSSAETFSGFSAEEMRKMVLTLARKTNSSYLHICEGAPRNIPEQADTFGKLVAYLVSDYIKASTVS